jgi:hypothetical protein
VALLHQAGNVVCRGEHPSWGENFGFYAKKICWVDGPVVRALAEIKGSKADPIEGNPASPS